MSSTIPTRIDTTLFEEAKAAGKRNSRSAAQQLAHWARLGKEIERSNISQLDIDRCLAGQMSFDDLGEREQAAVAAQWRVDFGSALASLNLEEEFEAEGRQRWSELDEDGQVVVHHREA